VKHADKNKRSVMELKIRNNVEGLGAEALSWKEETIASKSHKGNSQKYGSLLHGELKRRELGIKNHQKPIGLSEFEPGNPWKACFSLHKQETSRTCFQIFSEVSLSRRQLIHSNHLQNGPGWFCWLWLFIH